MKNETRTEKKMQRKEAEENRVEETGIGKVQEKGEQENKRDETEIEKKVQEKEVKENKKAATGIEKVQGKVVEEETEEASSTQSSSVPSWEEVFFPVGPLERDSSLSASLEGRLSPFTSSYEEGEADCSEISEGKEGKYSEDNDNEAETETDFFNGKDLSSEAIRQRLWRGVKSLSLDADVSMDPDVFCFLIEQSSKHCRRTKDEDRRTMPKRRNSEVALQELVKENTEIIERILKQKSLESSTIGKSDVPPSTSDRASGTSTKESEKQSGLSTFIKLLREKSEHEPCSEPDFHKILSPDMASTTTEPQGGAIGSDTASKVSTSKSSKQISPPYLKSLTPEKKSICKREENVTALSPTQPLPFNPFPTRNVPRQPKEITVKLGLYSPSKKTTTSS